ncbi:enoyl-CoA hydratase/isomerase-like protein [Paraburkholderia caballeronis]|nr:enoyl-CoA hydratase/isomerase-like protein [Paraburkholderia caballeronis]
MPRADRGHGARRRRLTHDDRKLGLARAHRAGRPRRDDRARPAHAPQRARRSGGARAHRRVRALRSESRLACGRAVRCGGGHFCAGADLSADDPGALGPTRMTLTKPTIAAVSGYAVAGGLELALMCDPRVVDEDAVPGVFRRRIGIPLIDGGAVRLPRLIGLSRALDLILTGRAVDARDARSFGLANRIVPRGGARAAAEALAAQLAAFPQAARRWSTACSTSLRTRCGAKAKAVIARCSAKGSRARRISWTARDGTADRSNEADRTTVRRTDGAAGRRRACSIRWFAALPANRPMRRSMRCPIRRSIRCPMRCPMRCPIRCPIRCLIRHPP